MPYVITTRQPETHEPGFDGQLGNYVSGSVSRRAVATLEEARDVAQSLFTTHAKADAPAWRLIEDDGGTIGPLPDGTVIEVEAVGWQDLAERTLTAVNAVAEHHDEILYAYNARS